MTRVLITGAAGFIGFHTALRFLERGCDVLGYDALTPYYDPRLKQDRLDLLTAEKRFDHVTATLEDREALEGAWEKFR
uniref:NAD-dependent epimerase/dehydratase family protein n=1 Tax=Microbacterium azadirachtae TaxID=582680 RepID=UPI003F75707E